MSQYLKGSISGLNRGEEHDCKMTIVIHCNLVMNPCIDLNDKIFINLINLCQELIYAFICNWLRGVSPFFSMQIENFVPIMLQRIFCQRAATLEFKDRN